MRRRLLLGQPHRHLGNTVALNPVRQAGVNGSSKAGLFHWKLKCRAVGCPQKKKKKKNPLVTARPQGQALGSCRAPEGKETKDHSRGSQLSSIISSLTTVCLLLGSRLSWNPQRPSQLRTWKHPNLESSSDP